MSELIVKLKGDPQSSSISVRLGLGREREKELISMIESAIDATETYLEAVAEMSIYITDANELVFVAYFIGGYSENERLKEKLWDNLLG